MRDLRKVVKEKMPGIFHIRIAVFILFTMTMAPTVSSAIEYRDHTYIPVQTVVQEQRLTCWAASALAVLSYYGDDTLQQCDIVNWEEGRSDCCDIPTPSGCNVSGQMDRVDNILEHYGVSATYREGALSVWETGFYLWAEKPFVFRWAWDDGGAHALVGIGFQAVNGVYGTPVFMSYMDPWLGTSGGKWTAFYDWVYDGDDDPDINGSAHEWTHTAYALTTPPDDITLRQTYEFVESVWEETVDDNAWYYYANDELIAQDFTVTTKTGNTNPLTEQMMDSCTWYSAGNKITLKPGFGVSNGTCFKAFVD